jgi:hypothetical protein
LGQNWGREKYPARNSKALKRKFRPLHKSEVPADESNIMYTQITRAKAAQKCIVKVLKEIEESRIKRKEEAGDGTKQRSGKKIWMSIVRNMQTALWILTLTK